MKEIDVALDRFVVAPDLQAERALHEVERRPSLALPLDHRELRFVVAERPQASLVVERKPEIVDRIGIARDVFGIFRRPRADKLGLRKRTPFAVQTTERQRAATQRRTRGGADVLAYHVTSTVLDPIWNRPLPS